MSLILLNYQQSWHKEKVDNTSSSCPEVFFLKSHFGMGVILQICGIFSELVFLKTPLVGCFCNTMKNAWQSLNGKMTKILELASLESLRKKCPYSELFWFVFSRIFYLFIYLFQRGGKSSWPLVFPFRTLKIFRGILWKFSFYF